MKKIFNVFMLILMITAVSCNESKRGNDSDSAYDNDDSKDQADEQNAEKFEDNDMEKDADWVADVVESNYGEIKFATLATQRSSNTEVKRIAEMLVNHHTATLNDLKTLAQNKAISIPVEEGDDARRTTERFSDEAGKDFDKRWCKEMVDRHEESINKFEKRLDKTEDAELKAFINKTLPTLKTHLDQLNACHEKIQDSNS